MKKRIASVKDSVSGRIDRFRTTDAGTLLFRFKDRCAGDNIFATGAQLAYHLLIAIFPLLIFILSVLSFTTLSRDRALQQIFYMLPENTRDLIMPIVLDVAQKRSATLLSTSLILALWSGSSGVQQVIRAMDKAFDVERGKRNFLIMRGLSLVATLVLVSLIVLTLASQVFGTVIYDFIVSKIGESQGFLSFWNILVGLVPVILIILAFTIFYFIVPAFPKGKRIRLFHAFLGGLTAGLGWLIVSYGFQFYVNQFSNYANTYGSLGGIIVLLIWLYLSSVIIMAGAEAAASLTYLHRVRLRTRELVNLEEGQAALAGRSISKAEHQRLKRELRAQAVNEIEAEEDIRSLSNEIKDQSVPAD